MSSGSLSTSTGNNFFHLLTRDWQMHFDKELFILPNQQGMTYSEALDHTQRLAATLVALGVEPGDRVAVQVDKSPMAVLLYLACLQIPQVEYQRSKVNLCVKASRAN